MQIVFKLLRRVIFMTFPIRLKILREEKELKQTWMNQFEKMIAPVAEQK